MKPFDPATDYPIGLKRPDLVTTPEGRTLAQLTFAELRAGRLPAGDLRATPETLRRQADVARAAGRSQLADNLERAAELTAVPDDVILDLYSALRPGRSTPGDLAAWADRLEHQYEAPAVADFIREAAHIYRSRGFAS